MIPGAGRGSTLPTAQTMPNPIPPPGDYIPHHGRVIGLDWGTSRIGLAITDETQLIARPLTTLTRRAGKRAPLGDFLTL